MNMLKKRKLVTAILAGVSGLLLAPGSIADDTFMLEEIIVTAQKRTESVQEVAAAISALSGSMLDARGITNVESLVTSVPGMHFSQSGANARITVRGIGTEQTTVTGDPGVAFHIDGVYQSRASAGSALFYDLDRVEVLRGPQGTLYGRNATGGSVNLISKRPTEELGGNLELQLGNYNQKRVRGVFNTPLTDDDSLMLRVSGQQETRDGYLNNLTPGADDLEDRDALNLRTQLLYLPTDDLEVLLSVNYSTDKGAGQGQVALGDYPVDGAPINALIAAQSAPQNPSDPWDIRTSGLARQDNDRQGATLAVDWDLGNVTLKSISAWQKNTVDSLADGDFSSADVINENRYQSSEQYSQELQLSSAGDGPWEWVTGLYAMAETSDVDFWYTDEGQGLSMFFPTIDVGLADPSYFGNKTTVNSDSLGIFGQTSYRVTEEFKLTAGLRYSKDKKTADVFRKGFGAQQGDAFPKEGSWSAVTWKLGADWWVTEDSMLYASVSTGFKSGGFLQKKSDEPYDEEEILAWEIGSKNRFFDDRLQANVSAFFYEYSDMQLRTIRDSTSVVSNAGEAEIKGLEIELLARPLEALELSAALAYTDAKFTNYTDDDPLDGLANTPLDLSGNDLARSPDYTANLSAAYTWQFDSGSLTSSVNYYWSDEVYFSAYNRKDVDYQGSYQKTDVNLTFNSADQIWYVSLVARNLENAEVASNISTNSSLGGLHRAQWQAPQTVSLTAGYHF